MTTPSLAPWRALFWEPVAGTGERLMVGVVYHFGEGWGGRRILRDDVLTALYGKAADGARKLIDVALEMYVAAARAGGSLDRLDVSLGGLHPSELRETAALSVNDLLRIAALQYSSLANLDALDDADESDGPGDEEITRRFSTDIRQAVTNLRPELRQYFGRTSVLVEGGELVRFGYASTRVLAHFSVLNPLRHGASLRDARGRLWELDKGRRVGRQPKAALISGMQRDDDPVLGDRQRARLHEMRHELGREAESAGVIFRTVVSAESGAGQLIELETA
ncbi:hypothetical protein CO641_02255 [Lysobacteraceae bacterium NML91-0213]|nr:hypothetical protein CO641_02255 [Xanthomonadaceae bacterium NML91-0213]